MSQLLSRIAGTSVEQLSPLEVIALLFRLAEGEALSRKGPVGLDSTEQGVLVDHLGVEADIAGSATEIVHGVAAVDVVDA